VETIEQKINNQIAMFQLRLKLKPIDEWTFTGKPRSCQYDKGYYRFIDNMIRNANAAECLTSPCEYIRLTKQYFERCK
jgi:hypothetical protein